MMQGGSTKWEAIVAFSFFAWFAILGCLIVMAVRADLWQKLADTKQKVAELNRGQSWVDFAADDSRARYGDFGFLPGTHMMTVNLNDPLGQIHVCDVVALHAPP